MLSIDAATVLLQVLLAGPSSGPGIRAKVDARTEGGLTFASAPIYAALRKLEQEALVTSFFEERIAAQRGRPPRLFGLTEAGVEAAYAARATASRVFGFEPG